MGSTSYDVSLFKDFADAVRLSLTTQGHDVSHVQNDDHAAVMLYFKTDRYDIKALSRSIKKPADFLCPPEHLVGLQGLEKAILTGADLKPYRSRQTQKTEFQDGLLDHWNIHHFHLGNNIEEDGFVERTNDLLFCLIEDTCAYFIKITSHDSSPWVKKELITIIHQNWPAALDSSRVRGISSLGAELQDDDLEKLRKARLVTILDMEDGTFYIEPGIGRTMGGLHARDLMMAGKIRRITNWVEKEISKNWPEISDNARKLGYHFQLPVLLTLLETVPYEHWDMLEPESGYRFRIYLH